jgi:TRAP-type transport system periplasmic protein
MRLSQPNPAESLQGLVALRFASAVKRRSNGQLQVDVYPNGQLAKQEETIDNLSTGVLDLAIQSTPAIVRLIPQFQVLDMPFLFKDLAAAQRVLDGAIGDELFSQLYAKDIVGLGWGTDGFRALETTSRPILTVEDMKGLRIRVQGGAVFIAMYQALAAIPLTIDLHETFLALQQHTVDAIDLAPAGFTSAKFYTVARHVAMSNHVLVVNPLMGSRRKIEALPVALQKILKEEGRRVVPYWRSIYARELAEDIQLLKSNGVAFTEIQYAPFRKAVDPVYAGVQPKIGGDLLERVIRAANEAFRA